MGWGHRGGGFESARSGWVTPAGAQVRLTFDARIRVGRIRTARI